MPEVIEIRKYADFLKKKIKNKYLKDLNILKGRYKKKPFNLFDINNNLPLKVIDIKTKGKFLYFVLENNYYFYSTLGLRGGWVYYSIEKNSYHFPILIDYINNNKLDSYKKAALNNLNIELKIDGGILYYYDTLSFGTFKIVKNEDELIKKLKSIGPDIMEENTTFEIFKDQIFKKTNLDKYIGNALINQKSISGIGNYLRADILWLSRISPFRKVKDLSDNELKLIYKNAKLLTWGEYNYNKGIKLGYINKNDKLPKDYKRNFFAYGSEYDINGNKIITEKLYEGIQERTIYWVPNIQK
jgi:formamidopyrimidine-DNA glycosylase